MTIVTKLTFLPRCGQGVPLQVASAEPSFPSVTIGYILPDDLLHRTIAHQHDTSWQEGVAEAVAGYTAG